MEISRDQRLLSSIHGLLVVIALLLGLAVLCLLPAAQCPACAGIGRVLIFSCNFCDGDGRISVATWCAWKLMQEQERVHRANQGM
jgi:hypothetical protein